MKLRDEKVITENDLWLADQELRQFTDICGACERIKNTPIPFIYSIFLKKFIFFYVMLMPVAYVSNLGYLVVPMTVFIFYVLASIEVIAEEIENPFGTDGNDLPLDALCGIIKKTVGEVYENN